MPEIGQQGGTTRTALTGGYRVPVPVPGTSTQAGTTQYERDPGEMLSLGQLRRARRNASRAWMLAEPTDPKSNAIRAAHLIGHQVAPLNPPSLLASLAAGNGRATIGGLR